ncbi:hypothetical protein [Ruegeria sp. ANG-S4]|uniref:hypothetical protein n=1 Tax=Ruegeria sp. ANG-S4 TaxID=1577904 RepID=UPI000AD433B6|nr:hypothetical protein [Ruegeria sp. ANG-S4]
MAEKNTPKKHGKSEDARQERLKAALKANMARRKAQAKARAASDGKAGNDEG